MTEKINSDIIKLNNTCLYFLHIPKTAGTTFISILQNLFDANSIMPEQTWHHLLSNSQKNFNFSLICGHFGYGIVKFLKNPICVTFLRDPVERTRSFFDHFGLLARTENNQLSNNFFPESKNLNQILQDDKYSQIFKNSQTRYIALDFDTNNLTLYPDQKNYPNQGILEENPIFSNPTFSDTDLFELAKNRLQEFPFFGIVEKFEKSLHLFYYTFGFRPNKTTWKLMTTGKTKTKDLDAATISKIKNLTDFDNKLYIFANELFEKRYSSMMKNLNNQFTTDNIPIFDLLEKNYQRNLTNDNFKLMKKIEYTFDQGINGSGWYYREFYNNIGYRWMSDDESSLDFLLMKTSDQILQLHIINLIDNDTRFEKLHVSINGVLINFNDVIIDTNEIILKYSIPKSVLQKSDNFTRISFSLDDKIDILTDNPPFFIGTRKVGLAFHKIQIFPSLEDSKKEINLSVSDYIEKFNL